MIQLAAVQFDFEKATIGSVFNRCLWLPNNRFWDEDTRQWWGEQKAEVLDGIFDRAEDPALVMQGFIDWTRTLTVTGSLRMWAKPISFDFPFLQGYCRQFGYTMPFHYRDAIDMQSFIRGMRRAPGAAPFDKEVPFEGDAHNAVEDVFHQIKVAITARDKFAPVAA